MAFKMDIADNGSLEVFLKGIAAESEEAEKKILKETGQRLKKITISELNKLRTMEVKGVHMADDVKVSVRTDKLGDKYVRVSGGKRTGTLWHIVNDGNLHSTPTHFMDRALQQMDESIDGIWNQAMK